MRKETLGHQYTAAEVRSGIFIIFALTLLLIGTFVVGDYLTGKTRTWKAEFSYIGGLEAGAPVYYAGMESGRVESIEVMHGKEKPILVTFKLSEDIIVREDSDVFIDMLGMMGEKIIEVSPGTISSPPLKENQIIRGTDGIPFHTLIYKMNLLSDYMVEMSTSLNPMVARLNGLIKDNTEHIEGILLNAKNMLGSADIAAQDISKISESLENVLGENQEDIAKIIANFHESSSNIRDMTHDLKYRPWRLIRKD